jgi:ElaB/YqjD/DUF883 family membrane-anchored ribosome-binding protein
MNDPADNPYIEKAQELVRQAPDAVHHLEEFIRKHPIAAALTSVGVGCVVGMIVHEIFAPPPPTARERAMGVLEDIQSRLADLMEPVSERVSHYAENGADAMHNGIDAVSKSKTVNRLRNLFS